MKVEQSKVAYSPITITLETAEELRALYRILDVGFHQTLHEYLQVGIVSDTESQFTKDFSWSLFNEIKKQYDSGRK